MWLLRRIWNSIFNRKYDKISFTYGKDEDNQYINKKAEEEKANGGYGEYILIRALRESYKKEGKLKWN